MGNWIRPVRNRGYCRGRMLLIVAMAMTCSALALPSLSSGAAFYPFSGELSFASGIEHSFPTNGVAVDDFNGLTYVADRSGVVTVWDGSHHQIATLDGSTTPAGSFGVNSEGHSRISVAANNTTGDVYVLDTNNNVVDEFSSAGTYVCQITGTATPSATECNGALGSETPSDGFESPTGIAVNQSSGEVYVLDSHHGAVDRFTAAGAYSSEIEFASSLEEPSRERTTGLAVNGTTGSVYIAQSVPAELFIVNGANEFEATWAGEGTKAGSIGHEISVAVDDSSGRVFVTDPEHLVTDAFEASGRQVVAEFSHEYATPESTAVDQQTGDVYVGDTPEAPTASRIDIFGPAVTIPDVTTEAATNVTAVTAQLNGKVGPAGLQLQGCEFEYGTTPAYGSTAPCVPAAAELPPDETLHEVSADIAGLNPGTSYHFRLKANNGNGDNVGADETLVTLPRPVLSGLTAEALTPGGATLAAEIDPQGSETSYHFEWGATTAYEHVGPSQHTPTAAGRIRVTESLTGLTAGTHYHWRLVASNANGPTTSADHSFTYAQNAPALPDARQYELVTPAHKNAALIGTGLLLSRPDIAENGERVVLSSIQCFAEAASCTGSREAEGEPYSIARTKDGWVTTALAPPVRATDANTAVLADATTGDSLFSEPSLPGEQDNFYLRDSAGNISDIGPVTPPSDGHQGEAYDSLPFAATRDMSHVVFELTEHHWSFDESLPGFSLYELEGAGSTAPHLVAVSGGLGSHELVSRCGAQLAQPHGLSEDGSTIYFVAIGEDRGNCPAGVQAPAVSELYARVNASETVKISGRSTTDCSSVSCATSTPSDAQFEDASGSGDVVAFTDTQQLTDQATQDPVPTDSATYHGGCEGATGTGCNLYLYDRTASAEQRLTAVSAGDSSGLGPRVQRVFALSGDGSHLYFVARGVLTTTANHEGETAQSGAENLYGYERDAEHPEGHLVFITALSPLDQEEGVKNLSAQRPNITPDGIHLVFTSDAALTLDDTGDSPAAQIYEYDARDGSLTRLSVGDNGFNDDGNTSGSEVCVGGACPLGATLARSPSDETRRDATMSDDGQYVFFMSPLALTPLAVDRVVIAEEALKPGEVRRTYEQNVYEYHDGVVSLISDGKDVSATEQAPRQVGGVELVGTDTTGANVFFTTADRLVPQDTDSQIDYYDARIDGGFPSTIAPHECEGAGECRGSSAGPADGVTPGSSTYVGSGNIRSSLGSVVVKASTKPLTRAAKLAKALRTCKKDKHKKKRSVCEKTAHKRYGRSK
jgi:hypothetical protein